ncbi:hypothetical protein EDB19DRAFT_529562 [Suillus lakei]|nr:hypothetical protein EDB19DRAFT_529562 [Suillus lakei]
MFVRHTCLLFAFLSFMAGSFHGVLLASLVFRMVADIRLTVTGRITGDVYDEFIATPDGGDLPVTTAPAEDGTRKTFLLRRTCEWEVLPLEHEVWIDIH